MTGAAGTRAVLGRHLMTVRCLQWMAGEQGDPFALLLRGVGGTGEPGLAQSMVARSVRARGPLYRSPLGVWVTASHPVAAAVLGDRRLASTHPGGPGAQTHPVRGARWNRPTCHVLPLDAASLNLSAEERGRLQVLGLEAMPPGADAVADAICAGVAADLVGEVDVVADFARRTAVLLVGSLLHLSPAEQARLATLCAATAAALDATAAAPPLDTATAMLAAVAQLRRLVVEVVERSSAGDGAGLVAALARRAEAAGLDRADVVAWCMALVVAGVDMSASTVASAVLELGARPRQRELAATDPASCGDVVEEVLRYRPPVQLAYLVTQEETEVGGRELPADSTVAVLVGAAERDPAVHRDPDRFDVRRRPSPLVLQDGSATGAMAPFVRLHARSAVRALLVRCPDLRLAAPVLWRRHAPLTNGILRLPLITDR